VKHRISDRPPEARATLTPALSRQPGEGAELARVLRQIPHTLDIRIYYEDTDAGGIVYHARYLAFAERGRTEMLREHGVPLQDLVDQEGLIFVVRGVKMDYLRPARVDDILRVSTTPTKLGGAVSLMRQVFSVDGMEVARMDVQLACVRRTDGRPARIPPRWRQAFAEVQSGSNG
jgi:acyl-CoA thioester hydrolase